MYVDNTDLIHWTDLPHVYDEELVKHAQQAMTDFGKLVQTTGGDLKPLKSAYYFLTYHTVNGKPS